MKQDDLRREMMAKVAAAQAALQEAQNFADEHGLEFTFSTRDREITGHYYGKGYRDDDEDGTRGWYSSSQSC